VRSRCPKFNKYINKGQIHFNTEKKICLRRYSPNAQPIFFRKKESQYKQVLATQTLRNRLPNSKRDKIACVKIIGKNIKENTDLLDLKYKMDI
jgi:hypothetical protein